ncbi:MULTISPECIES: hypothetical protein [Rhizobium]|uniref:hypothetical protein n=1 Tax=Rhizobium TaxID=379 RepID=UPI001B323662|nr:MULTISPECIES: hypothetical protein [Rhizobium]MBX4911255.1 hypothetical protein [Rhizobium bangladeshense]MBX5260371.1 hypothetical protein [Rhizobium sp. NLR16b]MBX5266461.1 hypothetical protein [Rhizobium sp. NLR16a]MBX5315029.1 hypothetical protein [Rhizobium sp. NLR11b]QTU98116.1 hypothetical protein J7U39_08110 [Rhizobium sp. NLR16a]
MTEVRKLTEKEAYFFLDFVGFRIFGWNLVDRKKHHPNSNAAKAVDKRFRDIIGSQPSVDDFVEAAMNGKPVHLLWPVEMQDEVKRAIQSEVPLTINEPTSDEFIRSMREGGRTDWVIPDFIKEIR